jgi:3-methyladenine DNA glycosylase AlkD
MSIIERIQQRKTSGVEQEVANSDAQMAEAQAPDAVQQEAQGREAHGKAMRAIPDREIQEEQAGPEEQAVHTQMEKMLIQAVHSKGMTKNILAAVSKAQDKVHGIGNLASDLVIKLKRENAGVTEDVLNSLGERAIEEIVELVETADPTVDLDADDMAEAHSIGLQNYMKAYTNEVNDEDVRGFLTNG